MKNNKFLAMMFLSAMLAFTSCGDDPINDADITSVFDNINIIDVNATVKAIGNTDAVGASSEVYVDVKLDRKFESNATVRVAVKYKDEKIAFGEAVILKGSDQGIGKVVSPASGVTLGVGELSFESATIYALGLVLDEPIVGEAYNVISNKVTYPLYSGVPEVSLDKSFNISLNWLNPANDLDIFLVGPNNSVVDYGFYGFPEVVSLPFDAIDGTYLIYVDFWSIVSSDQNEPGDFSLFYRHPNGELNSFHKSLDMFSGYSAFTGFEIIKTGTNYTLTL